MDAASSRVPAATEALLTRFGATMTDWQVFDAGPGAMDPEPDVLIVGFSDFDGTSVVEDVTPTQGMGRGRYTEVVDIRCILSSERGDETMTVVRNRCLAGLAQVEDALTADGGPTGVVDQWHLAGSRTWGESFTPQGATCEVLFTVQCRVTR